MREQRNPPVQATFTADMLIINTAVIERANLKPLVDLTAIRRYADYEPVVRLCFLCAANIAAIKRLKHTQP